MHESNSIAIMHRSPLEIAELAHAHGVPMALVLREAGVAGSTWWRWEAGKAAPRLDTLVRIEGALLARTEARGAEGASTEGP